MVNLSGRVGLVTGASSGIGTEFARLLAARGCNVVLTARRKDRLDALAAELIEKHSIEAEVVACDLSGPSGAATLIDFCRGRGISIVINNAGFGDFHYFEEIASERIHSMVELNVTSLVRLSHHFIGEFRARSESCYLLNVGSMVAWMPIAHLATYCGSKSFVRTFTESLAAELKSTNVSVTCLSPGGTRTEFVEVAGQKLPAIADKSLMSPQRCALVGLKALLKGKRSVVPGFSNKFVCFLTRFLPRRTIGAVAHNLMGEVPSADAMDSAQAQQ